MLSYTSGFSFSLLLIKLKQNKIYRHYLRFFHLESVGDQYPYLFMVIIKLGLNRGEVMVFLQAEDVRL